MKLLKNFRGKRKAVKEVGATFTAYKCSEQTMSNNSTKKSEFISISDKYFGRVKHYQTGERQMLWIKLYIDVLDDVDFCLLSDETKFHFFGLMLLAAKLNNRLPNNLQFLAQKLSATSEIDVEILLSKKFLIPFKPLKTKGKSDSNNLSDGYQNACLEENRREEIKNENENEKKREKKKSGVAIASPRKDVKGNGDVRAEETRIREIHVPDFYDKFLNYAVEEGFTKEAIKFNSEIHQGKHNDTIINLVELNKI